MQCEFETPATRSMPNVRSPTAENAQPSECGQDIHHALQNKKKHHSEKTNNYHNTQPRRRNKKKKPEQTWESDSMKKHCTMRLVLESGAGNSIFRSIRPGRSKAGSSESMRLVAMITWWWWWWWWWWERAMVVMVVMVVVGEGGDGGDGGGGQRGRWWA